VSETDDLRALMEADRWIERVSAQRTHLPESEELAVLESELRGIQKSLLAVEAVVGPIKSSYDDAARESSRLKKRANDLDTTLASSTANARELAALQKELTHVRMLLGESEDRELELLLEVDPREAEIASLRSRAQPGAVRRRELLEIISQLQASLSDELVSLRRDRDDRATALPIELLARYDVSMAHAGTSGAAQVIEGHCDGCRLALSPLDIDRWKGQPVGVFMDCSECGRLFLP
jgi:predicted  nucleic acid-binding Zn-ribbon protein